MKLRFILLSLGVSLTAALAIAGPSQASADIAIASNIQSVGTPLASDGNRYVAYIRPDFTPVVLDTFENELRPITDADACIPADVGGGRVLLECQPAHADGGAGSDRHPRVASVKGGTSVELPNIGGNDRYESVGRYWVAGDNNCRGTCGHDLYQNWRTGLVKEVEAVSTDGLALDLNHRKLQPRVRPFKFNPSNVLAFNRSVAVVTFNDKLWLKTASKKYRLLGDGIGGGLDSGPYVGLSIGGGRVTWVDDDNILHAAKISKRRQFSLKLPERHPFYGSTVVPVRDGIFFSNYLGEEPGPSLFGFVERYRFKFKSLP